MNLCDDNRIITIEKAKKALIKGTNIEDSPEEMKVLDNILFRCWQMGWLDRYAPTRHLNAMPKVISERMAAGHGSNVPMQPNIPPMPSNTSNALKALDSVNATQSNALDSISRQAVINAIEEIRRIAENELHYGKVLTTFNIVLNSLINIINLLPLAQPLNQDSIETQSSDLISRQAALELCDWYDNPSMREDLEKLRPVRFSADTISRQATIEALKNDMASLDHIIKGMSANDVRLDAYVSQRNQVNYDIYTINNLPPAQPEQLSTNLAEVGTDCISRQAAIDLIESIETERLKGNIELIYAPAIKGLRALPPAQPESDSGRWERHYSRPGVYADLYWHCSKCGYKTDYQYANVNHHYCPNCGRKMEREVSDE